jgi:hypothetical protein
MPTKKKDQELFLQETINEAQISIVGVLLTMLWHSTKQLALLLNRQLVGW